MLLAQKAVAAASKVVAQTRHVAAQRSLHLGVHRPPTLVAPRGQWRVSARHRPGEQHWSSCSHGRPMAWHAASACPRFGDTVESILLHVDAPIARPTPVVGTSRLFGCDGEDRIPPQARG